MNLASESDSILSLSQRRLIIARQEQRRLIYLEREARASGEFCTEMAEESSDRCQKTRVRSPVVQDFLHERGFHSPGELRKMKSAKDLYPRYYCPLKLAVVEGNHEVVEDLLREADVSEASVVNAMRYAKRSNSQCDSKCATLLFEAVENRTSSCSSRSLSRSTISGFSDLSIYSDASDSTIVEL